MNEHAEIRNEFQPTHMQCTCKTRARVLRRTKVVNRLNNKSVNFFCSYQQQQQQQQKAMFAWRLRGLFVPLIGSECADFRAKLAFVGFPQSLYYIDPSTKDAGLWVRDSTQFVYAN